MKALSLTVACLLILLPSNAFVRQQATGTVRFGSKPTRMAASDPVATITEKPLPPGRPTIRFLNVFFDDTAKLLNPQDMKLLARKEKFGPIFKSNFLFQPTVFVANEDLIQELAKEEAKKTLKAFFPPHHQKLFGPNSLLVQSGPIHAKIRRIVMGSMSPSMISSYDPIVQESVTKFFQEQKQASTTDYCEMLPRMRTLFISIMLQVVLGTPDISSQLVNDIEIWANGLLAPPLTFIPWSTAGKAMRARKRVVDQLGELMQDRSKNGLMAKLQQAKDPETGESLSCDEIMDNLFTLVFAGSDTTSSAAISVWITLSKQPKLKEELKTATPDQLEAFCQNILEAFPPAPFQMRATTEELEVGGYRIPAKWQVAYLYAAALNGTPSPQQLCPATQSVSSPASSSTAFGQGPRKCPGRYLATMELKLFTRALVQQDWKLQPDQDLEQTYTPGYFPKGRLMVKFT